MKIVNVRYTTTSDYANQNRKNIEAVMNDLRQLSKSGIKYNVCLSADAKTFHHLAFFESDDDHKTLIELPSFITFQQQLKASAPEKPPVQEQFTIVGSSYDIF